MYTEAQLRQWAEHSLSETDIYLFNTGAAQRAYLAYGCHYIPELGMHRFVLWAPNAEAVSLVGDFNGWDPQTHPMLRYHGGVFVLFVAGLQDGDLYKYAVRQYGGATVWKADPFAFYAETGSRTASRVWSLDGYAWSDAEYLRRRAAVDLHCAPLSIYELHLGSWRLPAGGEAPGYRQIAEELAAYCVQMGYTHIELLPLTEYPFAESWGYQVTGYYAPTARYGTPQDLMYFVDTMHRHGIGVILDWVPAHFPRDEHGLARFDGTALFEHEDPRRGAHAEWGTLIFNFGRPEVQSFLISSAMLFFDRYHIDGIRVDAVSSMLYLDYGRKPGESVVNRYGGNTDLEAVDFLRKLNQTVLSAYPGCLTIAEESTAYPMVTWPPQQGGLGFSFKWDMGFMHDTLDYMMMDPYFRQDHHDKLTFSMMYCFSESFVLAFSHDEVVHGKRSMLDKMFGDYAQKFASLRALLGYQYGHPGKKHNFMGTEFGQFIEWDHHRQLDWLLLDYPQHAALQRYVQALNRLYTAESALYRVENSWDGFTWLNVMDASHNSIAFLRRSDQAGPLEYIVCVCRFAPDDDECFVLGLPLAGTLTELLNSDAADYGGHGFHNPVPLRSRRGNFQGHPYQATIRLPGFSTVFFRFQPDAEQPAAEEMAAEEAAAVQQTAAMQKDADGKEVTEKKEQGVCCSGCQ